MIGTIARVARGEGLPSVVTRGVERVRDAWQSRLRLARGAFAETPQPSIVNVLSMPPVLRLGGVPVQLLARLDEERAMRDVALFHGGVLTNRGRAWRTPLAARTLIVEGGFEEPLPPLRDDDAHVFVVHDFSLRDAAPQLLAHARAAIFPSAFLRDAYAAVVPRMNAHVIAPGVVPVAVHAQPIRNRIAFCGSVKPHKGGALIPEVMRAVPAAEWYVFGGGDADLLRSIPRAAIHGYYRAGTLPRLLARQRIGLAVLPSIVPESFSLTLSECWSAGVPVVAFDQGAIAERIRAHGGGFLVPLDAGADGLAACVRAWLDGAEMPVPRQVPTARDAATAHVALYRALGLL
jgi:glycosyltransferase involved in cell wall biosynthesis